MFLFPEKESFGQTKLKKSVATTEKKLRPPDSSKLGFKHTTVLIPYLLFIYGLSFHDCKFYCVEWVLTQQSRGQMFPLLGVFCHVLLVWGYGTGVCPPVDLVPPQILVKSQTWIILMEVSGLHSQLALSYSMTPEMQDYKGLPPYVYVLLIDDF